MKLVHDCRFRTGWAALMLATALVACQKQPPPAPTSAPPSAESVSVEATPAAAPAPNSAPPPTTAEAAPVEVDYSKMSNEDKYMQEMASSITTYIQDHLRNKGRMPKDANDILALKIMDRLEVPNNYLLVIDQKTGAVSFKKLKK